MALDDIKNVIIDAIGGYKFIVISVSDGQSKKLIVRANKTCDYHRDILSLFRPTFSGLSARCIGGGEINVDTYAKKITIWGRSGDFGVEPDRSETIRILKEAYPDFEVISK